MSNSATPTRSPPRRALARLKTEAEFGQDEDSPSDDTQQIDEEDPTDVDPSAESKLEEPPSMDPEEGDDPEALDNDDEAFTVEDVIKCFLRANPTPTDEQTRAFVDLMDLEFEEFESMVFKKFGEVVRQATSIGPSETEDEFETDGVDEDDLDVDVDDEEDEDSELQADDELGVQDDIDLFVVAYSLFNPEPTPEQIEQLAFIVGVTKEQMEQRVFDMLSNFLNTSDENFHGEDEGSDDEGTDEEDETDESDEGAVDAEDEDSDDSDDDEIDDKGE